MTDLKQFKLPDVGEGLTEADIVKWHVQPGDKVTINQIIVEIETAKAVVELPSPYAGVVTELLATEGTTVDVGIPIVSIDVDGGTGEAPPGAAPAEGAGTAERTSAEALPAAEGVAGTEEAAPEGDKRQAVLVGYGVKLGRTFRRTRKATPETPAGPAAAKPAAEAPAEPAAPAAEAPVAQAAPAAVPAQAPPVAPSEAKPVAPANGGQRADGAAHVRVLAKPPVRKLAKDLGVDLNGLTGSGPQGSITRDDVQQAAQAPASAGQLDEELDRIETAEEFEEEEEEDNEERVPIRGVRKHTAAAVTASAFTAPHVTEFLQVDVTAMTEALAVIRKQPEFTDIPVRPLLLVARALMIAVDRNPMINSSWDEKAREIVIHHYVNLGIAAATERGLIVPNIKHAHTLSLPDLAEALNDLARTARAGKTTPDDLRGGTITITNVGVFGVDAGTPILTPGEAAILAVGRIKDAPWVYKGELAVRKVTTLALSFDHRIVDGDLGSTVLREVGAMLEDPLMMIAWS